MSSLGAKRAKVLRLTRSRWALALASTRLGVKVTVTKGVTIGDNAVVGANSVATRDIPANCVAAVAPARVIRNLAPAKPEQGETA